MRVLFKDNAQITEELRRISTDSRLANRIHRHFAYQLRPRVFLWRKEAFTGMRLARELGVAAYVECSAKTGDNIPELLHTVVDAFENYLQKK